MTPYDEIAPRLCVAGAEDRVTLEVGGASTEGRELPVVTVTAPWTAEEQADNERLESLLTEDPLAAQDLMAAGGYDDYRPVLEMHGNIHGNEYEGMDGSLELIEYLATAEDDDLSVPNVEGLTSRRSRRWRRSRSSSPSSRSCSCPR